MMRWFLIWLALLVVPAQAQLGMTGAGKGGGLASPAASGYTGPGDIVSNASPWYGLRAYSGAYAATPGLSVNVRRSSDNVACDVNVAASGALGLTTATCNSSTQGGISPSAFAGTDATAICTLATTTATCTGASSTPHVSSTITGAGLTQPCIVTAVGTFTGGAGTMTVDLFGTTNSCGTISVGETFTMTYGLFGTEAYDQTGNGKHATQGTAGTQPQVLPTCPNGFPCFGFAGAQQLTATLVTAAQPFTYSLVAYYVGPTANLYFFATGNCSPSFLSHVPSGNLVDFYNGTDTSIAANDAAFNIFQLLASGASSVVNVNNSETTVSSGANATGTSLILGGCSSFGPTKAYEYEFGRWSTGFSSGQRSSMYSNQAGYY